MRVIYLNKKNMKWVLVGIVLLAAALFLLTRLMGAKNIGAVAEPIYQGSDGQSNVAIAVNVDWGEDVLPDMLQVLRDKDVKATFFVTGRFAEKFPEFVKSIAADGHEIANHGYSHPHHDQISVEANLEDIRKGEKALQKLTGAKPVLFAPAYGEHGANCLKAAEQNGNKVILWTADTVDWQTPVPDKATLIGRVTGEKLHNGTIILMHPKEHTVKALAEMIDTIRGKGYTLCTISHMLDAGESVNE